MAEQGNTRDRKPADCVKIIVKLSKEWTEYPDDVCDALRNAYLQGNDIVELTMAGDPGMPNIKYIVNFVSMEQTNVHSKKIRKIKMLKQKDIPTDKNAPNGNYGKMRGSLVGPVQRQGGQDADHAGQARQGGAVPSKELPAAEELRDADHDAEGDDADTSPSSKRRKGKGKGKGKGQGKEKGGKGRNSPKGSPIPSARTEKRGPCKTRLLYSHLPAIETIRNMLIMSDWPFEQCKVGKQELSDAGVRDFMVQLEINGQERVILSGIAAMRYIGAVTRMYPTSPAQAAEVDEIVESVNEYSRNLAKAEVNGHAEPLIKQFFVPLNEKLERNVVIDHNGKKTPCGYLVGNKLSIADFELVNAWQYTARQNTLVDANAFLQAFPMIGNLRDELLRNARMQAFVEQATKATPKK